MKTLHSMPFLGSCKGVFFYLDIDTIMIEFLEKHPEEIQALSSIPQTPLKVAYYIKEFKF